MAPPTLDEFYCTILGSATAGIHNFLNHKPVFSRIPLHAALMVGGYFIGKGISSYKADRVLRREVWLWEYVRKHPEDFPELTHGKKYKDLLLEWTPIR